MKLGRAERVLESAHERYARIQDKIRDETKGIKPFRKAQPTGFELLFAYDNMTEEEEAFLVQKHGLPKYASFMSDMQKKRRQYARR